MRCEKTVFKKIKKGSVPSSSFHDLVIHDYTANLNSSSSFAVITVPPRSSHPKARSKRSDKYYFVKSGSITFALDNDELTLCQGDLLFIKRNNWFSYYNRSNKMAELILIHTPCFSIEEEQFK